MISEEQIARIALNHMGTSLTEENALDLVHCAEAIQDALEIENQSKIKSTNGGPFVSDWTWPNADHLEWRNRLWYSFAQFIKDTQGFIPDSRDCHHKYLFDIYLHGADSFPMECVLFLSKGGCNCQMSGPDVDRNIHIGCCMVGRAQKFLGIKVTEITP